MQSSINNAKSYKVYAKSVHTHQLIHLFTAYFLGIPPTFASINDFKLTNSHLNLIGILLDMDHYVEWKKYLRTGGLNEKNRGYNKTF